MADLLLAIALSVLLLSVFCLIYYRSLWKDLYNRAHNSNNLYLTEIGLLRDERQKNSDSLKFYLEECARLTGELRCLQETGDTNGELLNRYRQLLECKCALLDSEVQLNARLKQQLTDLQARLREVSLEYEYGQPQQTLAVDG